MPLRLAIVGAGPSGFYTADALLAAQQDLTVDLVEALPSPYGLVRGGVAPDHQSTKAVIKVFARIAENPQFSYYGNVVVGRDVFLEELQEHYDAVILACGAPLDRELEIPGAELNGVVGSAQFVGWYNGHPALRELDPDLQTKSVVVIGNGNVAIDVARVLAKTPQEMAHSDLMPYAAAAIHRAPLRDIHLVGRRGPLEAKFTSRELGELGQLADCSVSVERDQLPNAVDGTMSKLDRKRCERNLAILHGFAENDASSKSKCLHIRFFSNPVEILGSAKVSGIRFERTELINGETRGTGEFFEIPCGLVISAIGYRRPPMANVPLDDRKGIVKNEKGRVSPGLYVVGWARRGPSGVIGTNRNDGEAIAELVLSEATSDGRQGGTALEALLSNRGCRWVGFDDWLRIDSAEIAAASPDAPRRKFSSVREMLGVLEDA